MLGLLLEQARQALLMIEFLIVAANGTRKSTEALCLLIYRVMHSI